MSKAAFTIAAYLSAPSLLDYGQQPNALTRTYRYAVGYPDDGTATFRRLSDFLGYIFGPELDSFGRVDANLFRSSLSNIMAYGTNYTTLTGDVGTRVFSWLFEPVGNFLQLHPIAQVLAAVEHTAKQLSAWLRVRYFAWLRVAYKYRVPRLR